MGRIAWYGSSNDTDNANLAWSIGVTPDGSDWSSGSNRKGFIAFTNHDGEKIRVHSNGHVSLGTTTKDNTSIASIFGSIRIQTGNTIKSSSSGGTLQLQGGATYPGGTIILSGGSGNDRASFYTTGSSDTLSERARVYSGGMAIGAVGTYAPISISGISYGLNLIDDAGGAIIFRDPNTTTGYRVKYMHQSDGVIRIGTAGDDGSSPTEYVRITQAGNIGINSTGDSYVVDVKDKYSNHAILKLDNSVRGGLFGAFKDSTATGYIGNKGAILGNTTRDLALLAESPYNIMMYTNGSATLRLKLATTGGLLLGGRTDDTNSYNLDGVRLTGSGTNYMTVYDAAPLSLQRGTSDGTMISFRRGSGFPQQGSISVSGSTVSYNAFLGSHWGRLVDNSKPEILVGTIMETVNVPIEWKLARFTMEETYIPEGERLSVGSTVGVGSTTFDPVTRTVEKLWACDPSAVVGDPIQIVYEGVTYNSVVEYEDPDDTPNKHVCVKVCDTAASAAVFGVFTGWDDKLNDNMVNSWNDLEVGAIGNYFIRMASGQTPSIGDLVESDSTGCGVVQSDDIIRSKTVAKITSTTPQVTYDDGSFLVTCTLHCG
tara:strand:- start:1348 stop:3144 length:1797 start_codon:yes stop_codon:yes gene_type:complete